MEQRSSTPQTQQHPPSFESNTPQPPVTPSQNLQVSERESLEGTQVAFVAVPIMKTLEESFSKIQSTITSKEEEKDKAKKVESILNSIVKEMKKAVKKKDEEDLNVSWLIEKIEENISESQKLSKSKQIQQSQQPFPRPTQINIIENYMKVITYLLLFSKSSEVNQLIKILFYCLFSTGLPKTVITKQLGFLFDVVEPNGESLLMNPLNILMIKLDSATKRKSLQYLVEFYYYYRKDITPNFIDLISGTIECPTDSDKVINQVLVDYVIDFTFYMITESILDHFFVKLFKSKYSNSNTTIQSFHFIPPNILNNLFLLLITYFMNGYNIFYSDKLKYCFLMLFLCEHYEQRDGMNLPLGIGNLLINEIKANNTLVETALEQLTELVNIDVHYNALYLYLNNLIKSLNYQMHFILDYSNEQVYQYRQMVNLENKNPMSVLFLNKIDIYDKEQIKDFINKDFCYHEANSKFYFSFKQNLLKRAAFVDELPQENDSFKEQKKVIVEIENQNLTNKKILIKIILDKVKYIIFHILCKKNPKKPINEQAILSKYLLPLLNILSHNDYSCDIYNNIVLDSIVQITKSKGSFFNINEWALIFNIVENIFKHSNNSMNYNNDACVLPFIYELKILKFDHKYKGNKEMLFNFVSSLNIDEDDIYLLLLKAVLSIEFNVNSLENIQKIFYALTGIIMNSTLKTPETESKDNLIEKKHKSNIISKLTPNIFKDIFKAIYNYIVSVLYSIESTREDSDKLKKELDTINEMLLFYSPLIVQVVSHTQDYIIDLVNFIIDLCIIYRNYTEFTTKIIKSILTLTSNDNPVTIYSLNKMLIVFSEHYLLDNLKAVFSFLFEKIKTFQSSDPFDTSYYIIFIEVLEKLKISSDYTIQNLRLALITKNSKKEENVEIDVAYFDIVPLLDYLFKCFQIIIGTSSDSLFAIESKERLSLFFSESLFTNFLLFKFIDIRLLYEIFNSQFAKLFDMFTTKKQSAQILEQAKSMINILAKLSFHIEIKQKFDVIDDYIKYFRSLVPVIKKNAESLLSSTSSKESSKQGSSKGNSSNSHKHSDQNKLQNLGSFHLFLRLLNAFEMTMFSIISYREKINSYLPLIKRSLTGILDICADYISIISIFQEYQPTKFALFKLLFMIKEYICKYDDCIIKTLFLLLQISQTNKRLNEIKTAFKDIIDKEFFQRYQHSLTKSSGMFKKEYFKVELSSDLYFEVCCDYLMNYFLKEFPRKNDLPKCFGFIYDTQKNLDKSNSNINNKMIRDQIMFQNLNLLVEGISENKVENVDMIDIKNVDAVPTFYMEKNTFRFIFSYLINEEQKRIEIYIRTATRNIIKYLDISEIKLSNQQEIIQFIKEKLKFSKHTQLLQMPNDKSLIKMIYSLDSLSTYRKLFCKIIYGKYQSDSNNYSHINYDNSEESLRLFNSFVDALGKRGVEESNKNKIIHRDMNNEIEFELFNPQLKKQQQGTNQYKDDKVTVIWCEPVNVKLSYTLNELSHQQNKLSYTKMEQLEIEKAKDDNEFYIIIHPFVSTHYSVKIIVNDIKLYKSTFDRLFLRELVIEAGKNNEIICTYIQKMVVLLNTLSSFLNFLDKNRSTGDKDVLEYMLLNSDNLFNRFSQIDSLCHYALNKSK